MERGEYLDAVAAELKRLTPRERAAVRRELDAHIEDHAASLREHGYAAEEADERATAAMGDPAEVGRELAKQYPAFWLWLNRAAGLAVAVLCFWIAVYLLGGGFGNSLFDVMARTGLTPVWRAGLVRIDERVEIGDDTLRFYAYELSYGGQGARLHACAYDRVPFGVVDDKIFFRARLYGEDGEPVPAMAYQGAARAEYLVALRPEETRLTLRYERFGETVEHTITLPGEATG